ncbi:MAG: glutamyl-tRNA reductase [Xanthomonadaceae bacterium]|jgi:glutamyl-tRNA reductase|nr:glutamyl-tRNA reductase [Xanthomonadaceae bacterium]
MMLWVLGLNHQTAPVDLRERAAFTPDTLPAALASLRALPQVSETVLLSTCNRTELYAVAEDGHVLADWLENQAHGLRNYLYQHHGADAVRHLFRVATGLDSMVLGEPQILGQVKEAWSVARQHGVLGRRLDRLFQQTFAVAKRTRTDTRVGANPVSVASTAVRLAQDSFARLNDSTILLIGAGETIELAARHLHKNQVQRLLIANRTLSHAQELASLYGGYALPLTELDRHLAEADIVFSATASREPVLHHDQVASALRVRKHKPVLLFDLAVPRDIDPMVARLSDAYLYTVDDLERAVEGNRQSRREAADAAETIIDLQVMRFMDTMQANTRKEPLKRLRALGDSARDDILAKARQQLVNGRDADEVLQYLAHTLTNRLLHSPTAALREAAFSGDTELIRVADRLFLSPASPPSPTDPDNDADSAP